MTITITITMTTTTTTTEEMADLQLDDVGSSWIDTFSALDPKVKRAAALSWSNFVLSQSFSCNMQHAVHSI
jgi:hypothetical protein